ncbi:hypothetical protein QOZ80_6BG0457670 [Eleusine coracana subsp. coracana]|nr:hypothetical protein QOZ80_6BG0457670 [Eleusine coracana subsp. coracana]
MMEVEKPWEFKEEVNIMEEEEEDDAGALHTRTRERKNKAGDDHGNGEPNSFNNAEAAVAQGEEDEKKQSVFFDSTNVSNKATESSNEQEVTKVEQSGCKNENNNGSSESEELEKQENFAAQENNENGRNYKLENGLHSNGVQEASSSSETTAEGEAGPKLIATIGESVNSLANRSVALDISNRTMNKIQVHEIEVEKDENETNSKVNIEEYDLEKILDEQETHDLYCPNCKSCITRRVILRKRKRTVKQALRDDPPKKTQISEPSGDASNQMDVERDDQDAPEVFRCLSCFTFFIPTGCSFNIFRIFERRDMNQQVQVQHPSASYHSDNCGSWLLSCFQTIDSPRKTADADSAKEPLLSGSQSTGDKSLSAEDSTASTHINATNEKTEQSKIQLPAGSSSMAQTQTTSVTVNASSSTTITISSSPNKTGIMQTEQRQMVTGQQDIAHQEQIPPSAASDAFTNAIPLDLKEDVPQNTTVPSSGRNSFSNQEFFRSEFKFLNATPNKVLPEITNLLSHKPTPVIPPPVQSESQTYVSVPITPDDVPPTPVPASDRDEWNILKAIVYGGLVESITSLSVVSAAAASGAKTLDIFVLGIANLIGGLPIIFHNIADLRNLGDANENDEQVGHYWLQLGRRSKYQLHMIIALLSYILFGLLPPVIYGFSFRKSDNRENKMMVVAAASLACVALLAIGKAHVKRPRTYFTTLLYYLSIGLCGSGLSYVAGVLITRLLAHFGLIDQGGSAPSATPAPPGLLLPDAMGTAATAWASY